MLLSHHWTHTFAEGYKRCMVVDAAPDTDFLGGLHGQDDQHLLAAPLIAQLCCDDRFARSL